MLQVEEEDIRVVLAIDFGTTYSGYAYAHVKNPARIRVEDKWEGYAGRLKTPTVIKYKDETYTTVDSWGYPALARKPSKQDKIDSENSKGKEKEKPSSTKPIELFKLHLSKSFNGNQSLPDNLDYRKVITDYMKELWKSVKESLQKHWQDLDLHNQVLIILTVPAEFVDNEIKIVRECAFNAGLMKEKFSNNLQFTTEPEAAAIYCLNTIVKEEHNLVPGDLFMVVDCGGGTVDLTTREILEDNKLGEVTVREGDFCGSSFVDEAFLRFIGNITGTHAIDQMKKYHYDILQYIVKEFRAAKFSFTGEETGFEPYEFDLDDIHIIKQYIVGKKRKKLEENKWYIEIGFEEIKEMFDPVIEKIIHLIRGQLNQIEKNCSAMFLVGGFSESQYLQSRIKNEFLGVIPSISIPTHPITSVLNGAVLYGLNESTVVTRKLPLTYGTDVVRKWQPTDPYSPNGYVVAFETFAKRGKNVAINNKVIRKFQPFSLLQREISFKIYITKETNVKYCNDDGVTMISELVMELPENENLEDVIIVFTLTFGGVEIIATVVNQKTRDKYQFSFNYE